MDEKTMEGSQTQQAAPADQQMPLQGAGRSESEVQPTIEERKMERENREELGRFVHSACQLAGQPNLRDGFYTSPEEAHSKHHLDMSDVEHHHRSDEYAHAWQPLSPRRKLAHSRSTKDNKGHGSTKSSKSKSSKSLGPKEPKGVIDAVSAPALQEHPIGKEGKHPRGKEGELHVGDTTDHADGVSHESSQDGVGFYLGEPDRSQANMDRKKGYAEEPPGASAEGKPKVTFHLGSRDGMHDLETPPAGSPVTGVEGGATHRHRRYRRRHNISSKGELPYWQHLGSNVELDRITPVERTEMDDATALADGDLENIASHRYGNTWGTRKRKLSYTSSLKLSRPGSITSKGSKIDRMNHGMFVELDELIVDENGGWEWQEKARWIKFEEDLEEGADRWGKPHVASLSFHSLLELRRCIEQGALLLDLEVTCMAEISQRIVDQLIITDQLDPSQREETVRALLSRHQHVGKRAAPMTRNKSYFNLYGMDKSTNLSFADSLDQATKTTKPADKGTINVQNVDIEKMGEDKKKLYALPPGAIPYSASQTRPDARILRKIPPNAEATMVLAGNVDFLSNTVMAFVRLSEGKYLPEIMEVPLPMRFLFLVMGPTHSNIDCHEVGRSISTLMSNPVFLGNSYRADDRQDLLDAINTFLDNSIVLPPCELDKNTLLPILQMAKETMWKKQRRRSSASTEQLISGSEMDPLTRTGRLFGGMIQDVKRRYPWYLSDIKDGLNFHCFATFFFIYFACLSPAITFGGLLSDKTDRWLGVCEMLVMTSVGGVMFSLLSAQPLTIVGSTGPMLLFEESLYRICEKIGLEYMPMRLWINLWVAIFTSIVVMLEGSYLVQHFTRFTEEIFSALISLIFIYEVFYKLFKVFMEHPLAAYYPEQNVSGKDVWNVTYTNNSSTTDEMEVSGKPNTALLTLILTLGTYFIALYLKKFRNSKFLGRSARRALGDFGVPIAIAVMVAIDYSISETYTEKLDVPNGLQPTASDKRGWFINPMGIKQKMPVWAMFGACIPAMLLFILIFMEMQITSKIVNKKERKLKKGSGYHLDLFLVGLLVCMGGVFGLPLVTGAAVRSVTHVSALSVFSHKQAPGMKPELSMVREQRVTAFAVHIMIGVSAVLGHVLRTIPLAVLFGIFLYMGLSSTAGIQLFERIQLFFMPAKHHPMVGYVRQVPTRKIHMYTLLQVVLLTVMWAIKSSSASLSFPFALILTVPIRKYLLPLMFKEKELRELDSDNPQTEVDSDQDEPDFYEQVPMPV